MPTRLKAKKMPSAIGMPLSPNPAHVATPTVRTAYSEICSTVSTRLTPAGVFVSWSE